jgi:hypothetical protein
MERVAIVGGGATGAALAWCLSRTGQARQVVLFHDEDQLGGHSRTIPIRFDAAGRGSVAEDLDAPESYPVDIGVQFVCQSVYPNLYQQLRLAEFKDVTLVRHPALRMSSAFGDDLVWGNFPDYQRGERFAHCWDDQTRALAERFQRDVRRTPWLRTNGAAVLDLTVGQYLHRAGYALDSRFVRYLLFPYLCVINGYGTVDLLETRMVDLFPLFTRLPWVQDAGPYASFTDPGFGWDRFEHGATGWVRTMAAIGQAAGHEVRTSSPVQRVLRRGDEWIVEFGGVPSYGAGGSPQAPGDQCWQEAFDTVVLTTDMGTNRDLLAHADNPYWVHQREVLDGNRFGLIPGVCVIHQDPSVLAPNLSDQLEDGQFTGYFAWGERDAGSALYDLPYDLGACFQTFLMHNVLGTPAPCFVSMYSEDRLAMQPRPELTLFRRTWRHGRWFASFFREAKRALPRVQGLGGLWFAGNNTSFDSEEGALVSALCVAGQISQDFEYPFSRWSSAFLLFAYFREAMFPARSGRERLRRLVRLGRERSHHAL